MQKQPFEKHVWAEIDLEALRYNFREVKARAGALPLCAVVKADSYGHGAVHHAMLKHSIDIALKISSLLKSASFLL